MLYKIHKSIAQRVKGKKAIVYNDINKLINEETSLYQTPPTIQI